MAPKKAPESNGDGGAEPRRSGRIASQPPPALAAAAPKPASKAKPASKKRPADEEAAEAKKPASKKSKPESKAAETKEKPASKAATKPASKAAAAKPASKAAADKEKPTSKAAAKPASKSAAKPKSSKAAAPKEDAIPEDKEETVKGAEEEKEKEAPKEAKATADGKGEVEEGGKLPSITLKNHKGDDIDVSTLTANSGVVIFTYPKADTPGCTKQACGYRDSYEEFSKLGYTVYGLSSDTVAAQQKWVTKQTFQYELLADPKQELIKALGCFVPPKNTKRSHFIFEKGTGKLVDKKIGVKPDSDPADCVKFIKAHHK